MTEDQPNKVIAPVQFKRNLSRDQVQNLQEQGVFTEEDTTTKLENLELIEPQYGEIVVGTLTAEERKMYVSYHMSYAALDHANRDLGSGYLTGLGEAVREGREEAFLTGKDAMPDDKVREFYRLQRRTELLRSMIFWYLGERLDIHDHVIGVRSGGRVVRGRHKNSQDQN